MPFSLQKLTRLNLIALSLTVIVSLTALGFGFRGWRTTKKKSVSSSSLTASGAIDIQASPPPIIKGLLVQEYIALRPSGFDPAELKIPSGQLMLAVDDLTGIENTNLSLDSELKLNLKQTRLARQQHEFREVLVLPPGVYWLTETGHDKWRCRITVTDEVRGK